MKIGIATTTIHVPHALKLMGKWNAGLSFDYEWRAFVAADLKTPREAQDFCVDLGNCTYLSPEYQKSRGYACSELIGWNCIMRRSIAILEAVAWGADIIVLWDDDNLTFKGYFSDFVTALMNSFNGFRVSNQAQWFDVGCLLDPQAPHRGMPLGRGANPVFEPTVDVKVGVAAGICLGDPDVFAHTRIANAPSVHRVSELLREGIVVDPRTWTVFNSQNVAFVRELAPVFLLVPAWGRHDDIFASLIAQRIMRERSMHVHFGKPFAFQERNAQDPIKNMKDEIWGMEHILDFTAWLDGFNLANVPSVVGMMRVLFTNLPPWMPAGTRELGLAWCSDIEKVL